VLLQKLTYAFPCDFETKSPNASHMISKAKDLYHAHHMAYIIEVASG
jgi:hypothetical protein